MKGSFIALLAILSLQLQFNGLMVRGRHSVLPFSAEPFRYHSVGDEKDG
jgi:hypothetical protein